MSLADLHTRAAILHAIAEYDALGQAAFLAGMIEAHDFRSNGLR
jgi:hypothetical protein